MKRTATFVKACSLMLLLALLLGCQQSMVYGFVTPSSSSSTTLQPSVTNKHVQQQKQQQQQQPHAHTPTNNGMTTFLQAYVSPEESEERAAVATKSLHPRIGDLVRYYDLDGGITKGEELVGKISFLTRTGKGWLVELTKLEDVGDGYYAEYSSSKRMSKKTDRDLTKVSPLSGSFVRAEQAYKVPITSDGRPRVRQETYDLDDFDGPQMIPVDPQIVQQDGMIYQALKTKLIKNAALTGLAGTVIANILKGPEDATIYFAGALASVGYLYFLSVKTDTLASPDRKLGNNIANLRFLMPVFVIVGVALYNKSLGDANPVIDNTNPLDTVTPEQFASAVIGFLTYRIPLFVGQAQDALKELQSEGDGDGGVSLPGSAGMAMKLASGRSGGDEDSITADTLVPVLLVSGPQATGRSELVQQLLKFDDRLVAPKLVDRLQDGVTYERLQSRDAFLEDDGRFGLTKDAILTAAANAVPAPSPKDEGDKELQPRAVVVDADVDLARKLVQGLAGARLIGVWVGLNSVAEFESRLLEEIDSSKTPIPEDETRESVLRARMKEIVNEIEYGLSSGIFEFTILNENTEESLKELKEAAGYCFK